MAEDSLKKVYTKHEFYFETPLYEIIDSDQLEKGLFSGDVDAYNPDKGYDTTYSIDIDSISQYTWNKYYRVTLTCKRSGSELKFIVYRGDVVTKIGQWPTLADIQFASIGEKYDKVLPAQQLQELKRGIGLFAHGVGIGAFVYLRRIFEHLIFETYTLHKADLAITKEEFDKSRMEEKVKTLKAYLPSQLVEMKSIYRVLSSGIHKLSEQECMTYFPAVKLAIELILDQKIEIHEKKQRDIRVKEELQKINSNLDA